MEPLIRTFIVYSDVSAVSYISFKKYTEKKINMDESLDVNKRTILIDFMIQSGLLIRIS